MQCVFWDDGNLPNIIVNDYGDAQFFDRPNWYGFEVGDQIVHVSEIGPSVYRVVDVTVEWSDEPEYFEQFEPDHKARYEAYPSQELKRVTIQGV